MDESKEKINRAIYEALSLPGDEPPDYSLSDSVDDKDDTGNPENDCTQAGGSPKVVGLTKFLCNLNEYLMELKKEFNNINQQLNQKLNEAEFNNPTNTKYEEPYSYNNSEYKQNTFGQSEPYVPYYNNSEDEGYGLSSDKDLDELMFFDLMDDD